MATTMKMWLDCYQFGSLSRELRSAEVQANDVLRFAFDGKSCGSLQGRLKAKFGHVTCAVSSGAFGVAVGNGSNVGIDNMKNGASDGRNQLAKEDLDRLLRQSVPEIVKKICDAPLIVQVYSEEGPEICSQSLSLSSPPNQMKLVIEKATPESWPIIKQRWENSSNSVPNGIILVEELVSKQQQEEHQDNSSSFECHISNEQFMESSPATRLWGVLVQGRGVNFPACYVLKTCQVQCCFGRTTHFCLAKVDCFTQSFDDHLGNLWLHR